MLQLKRLNVAWNDSLLVEHLLFCQIMLFVNIISVFLSEAFVKSFSTGPNNSVVLNKLMGWIFSSYFVGDNAQEMKSKQTSAPYSKILPKPCFCLMNWINFVD